MRYYFTPTRMAAIGGKNIKNGKENKYWQRLEKLKPWYVTSESVKWFSHCGKDFDGSSKI